MSEALVPAAAEPMVVADGEADIVLPALIVAAGPDAVARFLERLTGRPLTRRVVLAMISDPSHIRAATPCCCSGARVLNVLDASVRVGAAVLRSPDQGLAPGFLRGASGLCYPNGAHKAEILYSVESEPPE